MVVKGVILATVFFGLANCRRDVVHEINVLFLNESYQRSLDIMRKLALSLVSRIVGYSGKTSISLDTRR